MVPIKRALGICRIRQSKLCPYSFSKPFIFPPVAPTGVHIGPAASSTVARGQAQHLGNGMVGGPPHDGQPRALVRHPGQHQKQGQFPQARLAQGRPDPQPGRQLREGKEHPKDAIAHGGTRVFDPIEVPPEAACERLDAFMQTA